MSISDLINALIKIKDEHGDLPVLHENDWDNFLIERVNVEETRDGSHPLENCVHPAHVVLFGNRLRYDCATGEMI